MAGPKVTITCGYVLTLNGAAAFGGMLWTEESNGAFATNKTAPDAPTLRGVPGLTFLAFNVQSDLDISVAVGTNPNPATDGRVRVRPGNECTVFARPGDKVSIALT